MSLLLLFLPRGGGGESAPAQVYYWFLGDASLPRPEEFTRENIFIKGDVLSLSGKTGRDIIHRKERFTLSWSRMTKDEFDDLFTAVSLNTALDFSVADGNFIISSTSVFPVLKSVEYVTLGENYLVSTQLELVEIE